MCYKSHSVTLFITQTKFGITNHQPNLYSIFSSLQARLRRMFCHNVLKHLSRLTALISYKRIHTAAFREIFGSVQQEYDVKVTVHRDKFI